jgi:hypothetical protein
MTYLQSILIPDGDLESFRAVDEALPTTRPAGLIARYVGCTDAGLVVTAIWSSKVDADRFGTEVLGPVVRRVHTEVPAGRLVLDYEAVDVIVVGAPA